MQCLAPQWQWLSSRLLVCGPWLDCGCTIRSDVYLKHAIAESTVAWAPVDPEMMISEVQCKPNHMLLMLVHFSRIHVHAPTHWAAPEHRRPVRPVENRSAF